MKIALCFYGYFGKENIKYKLHNLNGHNIDEYNEMWSIEYFKKNIIQDYDVDVFFHCWNQDSKIKNLLINEYKPKKYLFQKGIPGSYSSNKHNIMFYFSQYSVINFLKEYSIDNKINYDFIMISGFDNLFVKKINFNELNNKYIYTSNFNYYNKRDNYWYTKYLYKQLYDQWYITNFDNAIILNNLKELMKIIIKFPHKKYGSHNWRYILIDNQKLSNKLKFIYFIGIDHLKVNQIFLSQYKSFFSIVSPKI